MLTEVPSRVSTPWGLSQWRTDYGPGVSFYTTASHGGFHLDAERLRELTAKLGTVKTFCGQPAWFEEDCDWAYVALAFPELFTAEDHKRATATLDWLSKRKAMAPAEWRKP